MLLLTVLKPPKTVASADRSNGPILAPHGTYVRGKAIPTLSNGRSRGTIGQARFRRAACVLRAAASAAGSSAVPPQPGSSPHHSR